VDIQADVCWESSTRVAEVNLYTSQVAVMDSFQSFCVTVLNSLINNYFHK